LVDTSLKLPVGEKQAKYSPGVPQALSKRAVRTIGILVVQLPLVTCRWVFIINGEQALVLFPELCPKWLPNPVHGELPSNQVGINPIQPANY
jgi:hypothetical protein